MPFLLRMLLYSGSHILRFTLCNSASSPSFAAFRVPGSEQQPSLTAVLMTAHATQAEMSLKRRGGEVCKDRKNLYDSYITRPGGGGVHTLSLCTTLLHGCPNG